MHEVSIMLIRLENDALNRFTNTEKDIITFINANARQISTMSISEVAEATYSSPATVSRTIKKCGIAGFAELRYMVAHHAEAKQHATDINEIFNKSLTETVNTIGNLSTETILEAVTLIKKATKLFIFSKGLSDHVTYELSLKLQLLGKSVVFNADSSTMQELANQADRNSVLILLSMSGTTPELVTAAETGSMLGAKIITITCAPPEMHLNRLAQVRLRGYSHKKRSFPRVDVTSRLPLYVISRILMDYLVLSYQQEAAQDTGPQKKKNRY